jgi:hypothetical protein
MNAGAIVVFIVIGIAVVATLRAKSKRGRK